MQRLLRQLGPVWSTVAITAASVAISLAITVVVGTVFGAIRFYSFVLAIGIPSVVAPVFGGITLRLYFRLDRAETKLRQLAITDELTGVRNRRQLMELATAELLRARRYETPFSVVMLDIDDFKQINDEHGHPIGDEALRTVAQACEHQCRDSDVFGRYGGEEFVILLPRTQLEGAVAFAERLRRAVQDMTVIAGGKGLTLTISLGVTELDVGDSTIEDMIARADQALYAAKRAGKNQVSS